MKPTARVWLDEKRRAGHTLSPDSAAHAERLRRRLDTHRRLQQPVVRTALSWAGDRRVTASDVEEEKTPEAPRRASPPGGAVAPDDDGGGPPRRRRAGAGQAKRGGAVAAPPACRPFGDADSLEELRAALERVDRANQILVRRVRALERERDALDRALSQARSHAQQVRDVVEAEQRARIRLHWQQHEALLGAVAAAPRVGAPPRPPPAKQFFE